MRRKTVQQRRELMNRLNGSARPFIITAYDYQEKCITHRLSFITRYEAQDYLTRNTIKKGNEYYHKDSQGRLDMQLEYTLKNN